MGYEERKELAKRTKARINQVKEELEQPDPRDATIARLTGEIATFQAMMLDCEAEGDKARSEVARLTAELSELRARVEAAVALHFRDEEKWDVDERKGWLKIPVCAACGEQYPCPTLAILSPPEVSNE